MLFLKLNHRQIWILALLAVLPYCSIFAQISSEKKKIFINQGDTIVLDTLSIIPGSFILLYKDSVINSGNYYLDELTTKFQISTHAGDSLAVTYRLFPVLFSAPYRHKDPSLISEENTIPFKPYTIGKDNKAIPDDSGIQKSGSITRGIAFGNAQDLSVNSSLNLQLSGRLTERYMLLASITDDNIPIQPDGNTQQLQDFDQVFIQLYDDKSKLIAGDFMIKKPEGYFMNYFKRAQGGYFQYQEKLTGKDSTGISLSTEVSASVSKGRFARNSIQGVEGNQGPYRLTGASGETFIIVLAGTEAVYIDGKLLTRGKDRDYVIDYNSSEITFTPNQFITKDRRIVVEFQYSEKLYARPLLQANIKSTGKKTTTYLNLYSENDAKRQPLQQDLSTSEQAILAAAGDDLLSAYTSGIDSVEFTDNAVLYAMIDSLGYDSVFVVSNNELIAHYRLSFTKTGEGNGDYVEDGFTANGRKFRWVIPIEVDGEIVHQGNHSPIILLGTPKKKQMVTAGIKHQFSKSNGGASKNSLSAEIGMTNNDLNTFSEIGNDDNVGYALRTDYVWQKPLSKINTSDTTGPSQKTSAGYEISARYEFTDARFSAVERFREVEFDRNWNLAGSLITGDLHLGTIGFVTEKKNLGKIGIGGNLLSIGTQYNGQKAVLTTDIKTKSNFTAIVNASYLSTTGLNNSIFFRHNSTLGQRLGKFRIGFRDEHELNRFLAEGSDSLLANSYEFYDWEINTGTADTTGTNITLFYRERLDLKADSLLLTSVARAPQYGLTLGTRSNKGNSFRLTASNRQLKILNSELFNRQPENTLLIRAENYYSAWDALIQWNIFYEIGSGLEQEREFIYLQVPAGQGNYIWNDYNNDGVKGLDEFEIAQFAYEADYIRTFIPGSDYVRTYTNQLSQSVNINPSKSLKKKIFLHKFLVKFSDQVSYKSDRKTTREEEKDRFNPFLASVADSSLLALNSSLRNVLFFNKSNPVFGMDYTLLEMRNKLLLSNGFETRTDDSQQFGLRWNFVKSYTFNVETRFGSKSATSDFLSGRNFDIDYFLIKPKLTWQPNFNSRFSLTSEIARKKNLLGPEQSENTKLGIEFTINSLEKGSFTGGFNFIHIAYNSGEDNSLSFEMLEGLSAGSNYTWNAGLQRTVAKNLQLNLLYNARKPGSRSVIHTGGVQVRAFF